MQRVVLAVVLAVFLYGSSAQGQVGKNETVLNPNRAGVEQLLALAQLDSALVEGSWSGGLLSAWKRSTPIWIRP